MRTNVVPSGVVLRFVLLAAGLGVAQAQPAPATPETPPAPGIVVPPGTVVQPGTVAPPVKAPASPPSPKKGRSRRG